KLRQASRARLLCKIESGLYPLLRRHDVGSPLQQIGRQSSGDVATQSLKLLAWINLRRGKPPQQQLQRPQRLLASQGDLNQAVPVGLQAHRRRGHVELTADSNLRTRLRKLHERGAGSYG